jgi:hypothetical protein
MALTAPTTPVMENHPTHLINRDLVKSLRQPSMKGAIMKRYFLIALAFALTAFPTQPSAQQTAKPTVETRQAQGYTFTTFTYGDLVLTYVELDKSTAVVFKPKPPTGPDFNCLVCTVSKIEICREELCGNDPRNPTTPNCNSDGINECCREKCVATGECKPVSPTIHLSILPLD